MVSFTGDKDIDKVLKGMPKVLTDRVLKNAHMAAAKKTVVRRAQQLVPKGDTLNLHDSIGTQRVPFKRQSELGTVRSGPRRTRRYQGHAGHLVEFGTKRRFQRTFRKRKLRNPKFTGLMKKKPFMRPAFDQSLPSLRKEIRDQTGKKLLQFMKRTLKNGA